MPSEDWKLGGDLGRIFIMGMAALIAAWLYAPDICDDPRDAITTDPLACLLDANGCD